MQMSNNGQYIVLYENYPRFAYTYCTRGISYMFSDSNIHYCLNCYGFYLNIFDSLTDLPVAQTALWHSFSDFPFESRKCFICEQNLTSNVMIQNCPDCSNLYPKVVDLMLENGIILHNAVAIEYNLLKNEACLISR